VPPNRKRIGIRAPADAWKHLGELLEAHRRVELGYRSRGKFAAGRLPPTPSGNANVRLVSDIENSYRPDTYPAGTLRQIAGYYGVAYESMLAVLHGEADKLIPAEPVPPSMPSAPAAPGSDSRRTSQAIGEDNAPASWPHAEDIWERLYDLAVDGNSDPTGADLFGEGTDDARSWDDPRLRQLYLLRERVRYIADLRRREAGAQ
jgi:hypothetical protein